MRDRKKRNIIIVALCCLLVFMGIGYAILSQTLTINGIGNVKGNWNVEITNIELKSQTGKATEVSSSYTSTTASFEADLYMPGDSIEYEVTVTNNGNIDAVLNDIKQTKTNQHKDIKFSNSLIGTEVLTAGSTMTFTMKVEFLESATEMPDIEKTEYKIELVYIQYNGGEYTPPAQSIGTLSDKILADNTVQSDSSIDFSQISSDTNGKGLYYTSTNTEGNATTYYFRGAVDNNYVKFGTQTQTKNTCRYNGKDVVYLDPDGGFEYNPTEEQCLSTNVCTNTWYGTLVGIDDTTDITCTDIEGTSTGEKATFTLRTTCKYNGEDVAYYDWENDKFEYNPTEEQCLSTNVCVTTDYGTLVGIDDTSCTESGFSATGEKATYTSNVTEEEILWRVVRINEDGSTRLISENTVGSSAFNTNYNDNAYVGYMYGTAGSTTYEATHANTNNSTIKTYLDNWYQENLLSYTSYMSLDAGFCNDRSIYIGLGYGTNRTYYGGYKRLHNTDQPQFACPQTNDLFTMSASSTGNKALTYPVGLITADEVVYAGGKYECTNVTSYLSYLNNGRYFWTMSPWAASDDAGVVTAFAVCVGETPVNRVSSEGSVYGARPVINLASYVEITSGDGTIDNPYIVK